MPAAAKHRFVDHILGLLAGMFSRRSGNGVVPPARRGVE